MTVKSATHTSTIALLVLSLAALGFTYSISGGGHPAISAPSNANAGDEISVSATSNATGVRYVVTDENGRIIHEQDTTQNPVGEGEDGSIADGTFTIPADAAGSLTVTATDDQGQTSTQTIQL